MVHAHFSRNASFAVFAIGVIAGLIPALQGTLLPQLVAEGRLSLGQLGRVAMAEALGMLVALSVANAMLKPRRLRLIVVITAIIALLLNLLTARLTDNAIVGVRFAHGLCAGILSWIFIGFLTRTENPGRWIALFATAQGATLLVLSSWFTVSLFQIGGAMAAFAVIAVGYVAIVLLAFVVPDDYPALPGSESGSMKPTRMGFIGLVVVFCQLAAILALWVYAKPYGQQIGLSEVQTGMAISIGLGSQIAAGIFAAMLAGRVQPSRMLLIGAFSSIGSLAVLGLVHTALAYTVAVVAFAFLWMLVPPFQMPYLIDLDPSRRSAVHMVTAQLLGVAAGPAIASFAITGKDVTGALIVSAALYGLSAMIVLLTSLGADGTREAPVVT